MKIQFIRKIVLSVDNRNRLNKINEIIEDYASQGYKLTLRQLYYQLVSKNIIKNDIKEYANLGNLLTKGRMYGIVDWSAIEDRIRVPKHVYEVSGIEDAVDDAHDTYRLDRMKDQSNYIELWVEKDAISAVLSRRTNFYHIRLMVNRGYSSTTAMFDAYERFVKIMSSGKRVCVLYLGDHDPSGLDMIRDIKVRILKMLIAQPGGIENWFEENITEVMEEELTDVANDYFEHNEKDIYGLLSDNSAEFNLLNFYIYTHFDIKHIGLTSQQIKKYNPPKNPAKMKDPRSKWYVENFGKNSWEVDALNPITLHEIIDDNVLSLIDKSKFNDVMQQEIDDKVILKQLSSMRKENKDLKQQWGKLDWKIEKVREVIDGDPLFNNKETKKKGDTEKSLNSLKKIKDIVNS